jgi:hypothetical protein
MLKQRDISISKTISIHFGEEAMWYLTPTICFQRLSWNKKDTTYLFCIKFLKHSVGIVKRYYA